MAKFRRYLMLVIMILDASTFAAAVPGCEDSTGPGRWGKSGAGCFADMDCCSRICAVDYGGSRAQLRCR